MAPEALNNRNLDPAACLPGVTLTEPMSGQKEVVACCAKNCPSIDLIPSGTSSPVLLHSFPRWGSSRYKLWVGMVGVSPLPAVPKLCSLHFTPDQYKRTGINNRSLTQINEVQSRPKKLKKNALPSQFYDSDGELFEMVPVTIPEYSDEDPVEEVTLNSCSGWPQSLYTESLRDTLDSGTFPVANNNVNSVEYSTYQPYHSVVMNRSGGQQHAPLHNCMSKVDAAARGTLLAHDVVGENNRVIGKPPGSRSFGKGVHGCNFCGLCFSSHLNLGSHLRVHRTLPLKCHSCGLQLPNHWKLNQHLKVHSILFPGSKASIATSVESQEVMLGTLKLFECKDCGRRFKNTFWLALHAQVHSSSWQKAQERTLFRRKFSQTKASNQPVTTILQGSFSVLTQSPLFQSKEVLVNEIYGKTEMSQVFGRRSLDMNCFGYSYTDLPDKGLEVSIRKVHQNDDKFILPVESLTLNLCKAEIPNSPALESGPETLLKISPSDPCQCTKTSDVMKMGFVKKVYLCPQNTKTAGMSERKEMEAFECQTDKAASPRNQGCFGLQSSHLTALNKLYERPPNRLRLSLKARRCTDCGGRFTWPHSLALHQRKKHRRLSPYKHVCQCGRSFCNRLSLLHHELGHVRSECYICCLCGVTFKKSAKLVSHWQRHRGNGPLLKCICGLTFKRVGSFVWHLLRNKP